MVAQGLGQRILMVEQMEKFINSTKGNGGKKGVEDFTERIIGICSLKGGGRV